MTVDWESVAAGLKVRLDACQSVLDEKQDEARFLVKALGEEAALTSALRDRIKKLEAAATIARDALLEYVPHPLANDSLNMGTAAMQDRVRAALEAIGDALGAERANDR